jgi:hypothetical protein
MTSIVRPDEPAAATRTARLDRALSQILTPLLAVALIAVSLVAFNHLLRVHPFAVDIEIPLRAAERWLAGGPPYDPASFDRRGVDLPFLYPPFTLPLVAPLTWLPRVIVHWAAVLVCLGAALVALQRLGLPRWTWLPALIWPPFFEAILGSNVQVILFALYCLVFWPPRQRAEASGRPAIVDGVLTTVVGALKVSQFQPWLALLRHRPPAALLGAGVVVGLVLAMLPLTGIGLWFDWLGQAGRAGDPTWLYVGEPVSLVFGRQIGLALTILTGVAALLLPWRWAGVGVGLLVLLGAPSLHIYGWLFILPALLVIRREIALLAAASIATYQYGLIWMAWTLVATTVVASIRLPALRSNPGRERLLA